ncbi:MAG: DUF6580 family putative transport protein [Opitutaceae bacterium]
MPVALIVLVLAAGWRIAAIHVPALANAPPVMALVLGGAVYFPTRRLWLAPLAALVLSDLYLDHYYAAAGDTWAWTSALVRTLCFVAAVPLGLAVARRRNWGSLLAATLTGSVLFYLATNTDAWLRDPAYARTAAGWWQALTVGRPEFPPTLLFFRNTLVGDTIFTGIFAGAMEFAARRARRAEAISGASRA